MLRDYQLLLKDQIYQAWDSGKTNVIAVMPTGAGKTRTFCQIAKELAIDSNLPTAIMVHRKELVQQISLTLAEENIVHNIIAPRPTVLGIVAAQRQLFKRQLYDYHAPITVLSVDTLNARILHHAKWAKSIKVWVVDEAAHLLKKNKWGRAVEYFPNAIGLGVTATPQRLDKRGLGRHADGVFDQMIEGPTTRQLIDLGHLCSYKIAIPKNEYLRHLRKASDGADFTHDAMVEASLKSAIFGDAVRNYLKFGNGKQAIYFADSIISGSRMEAEFRAAGITAKLLTGDTDDKIRLSALIDFKAKKIKVLLNVDLFDEGLDVPGIEVVGLVRPTMSTSKYRQMVGRGLRPADGKPHLVIIDHVGNVERHGLPDCNHKWTLDRIKKRHEKLNLIRICENPLCNSPFDRLLHECPYCGWLIPKPGPASGDGRAPLEMVDGDLELLDPDVLRQMYDKSVLESPNSVMLRVQRVAGKAAGIHAKKNQMARIETQAVLVSCIALWAGKMKHQGLTDRMINKQFYIEFGKTITDSISEPKGEMESTILLLEGQVDGLR